MTATLLERHHTRTQEMEERPDGYLGPDLNPDGLVLEPRELAPGVHALLANQMPKDNNGLIVGERAALVVDAGINGTIARQIQALAQRLTDRPVRYLANTTYHGDHTFGNSAFSSEVTILSSALNRASMLDLAREKRIRGRNLRGNLAALDDVLEWRRPDIVFDRYVQVDLGGRIVELWHFGPGNAPGDTIVYVPDARVAWTGNFLPRAGIAPMLLEGGPDPYVQTLLAMQRTVDLSTIIVPGHGPLGEAGSAIDWLVRYLRDLSASVRQALAEGLDAGTTVAASPIPERYSLPTQAPHAADLRDLVRHLHRLNVLATYRGLQAEVDAGGPTLTPA
jgi:cyclase